MIIKAVAFAGAIGAPGGRQPPGALPQVAFSGRSNVGKSSLINTLLGRTRSKVARVSGTPGKTREVNFYRVRAGMASGAELEFHLVDLPGYGYARVPARLQGAWRPLIDTAISAPFLYGAERTADSWRRGVDFYDEGLLVWLEAPLSGASTNPARSLGPAIVVVNKFGSYFYGSLLGVFVLAIGTRRATGRGAFWGLAAGMVAVVSVAWTTSVSFLWYNVVGAAVVVAVGMALSLTDRKSPQIAPSQPRA